MRITPQKIANPTHPWPYNYNYYYSDNNAGKTEASDFFREGNTKLGGREAFYFKLSMKQVN